MQVFAMPVASTADFVDRLRQQDLVDASRLDELCRDEESCDTLALAKRLLREGLLTRFQVEEVWRGRGFPAS